LVIALGLAAWTASEASADTIINYSTSGTVESTGVVGDPVISFNSVKSASFNAPSAFSLGEFQVAGLQPGSTTTYTNTPFEITYLTNQVNGAAPSPNETPIQIHGLLNGTITGDNQSNVTATFDASSIPQFQTGLYANTLTVLNSPLSLVPNSAGGLTTAQAQIVTTSNASPIPEPTTIALFLTTLAGLGLRHRLRARRPA
jgi:hypothetical protein